MGLMQTTTVTDEARAKWEAKMRAEEARCEYGRTVDDARRLLKGATSVRLWVRRSRDGDANIIDITPSAYRKAMKYDRPTDPMPCEFDPEERRLSIGGWRAIYKLDEVAS